MILTSRLRQVNDEHGAVAVMVALSLIGLLGMLVLTVDMGGMLTMRRRMVAASDSAALAGAQSCAEQFPNEARSQADAFATDNEPAAINVGYSTAGCSDLQSSGTVSVNYHAPIDLQFAPVLGLPNRTTVGASATAEWGPAGGVGALPIVISLNSGRIPCVWKPRGTSCNYWYDNSSTDFTNSANWGFLNLSAWGVAPDDPCPNAGTSDRRDWILSIGVPDISIDPSGTSYVCADTGHSNSSWYDALTSLIGQIKFFPVNDPSQMILSPPGSEKYAIIGFTALKIVNVLQGNDPAAIGHPGQSGSCAQSIDFTPGQTVDVDSFVGAGCPGGAPTDSVFNLIVTGTVGSNTVVFQQPADFTFDPRTHVMTWKRGNKKGVSVSFDWNIDNTYGFCGLRKADPNGVCLVADWEGAQVGGTRPGGGQDFGVRAIRLSN
jgi:Putative Flp pilus-assembly TadE/G-like